MFFIPSVWWDVFGAVRRSVMEDFIRREYSISGNKVVSTKQSEHIERTNDVEKQAL